MKIQFYSLILIFFSSIALARGDVPYHYTAYDPLEGELDISIGIEPSAVYVGHAGRGAEICDHEDQFYCIESIVFKFSVPKKRLKTGLKWQRGGRNYCVANSEHMTIFGHEMDTFVVEEFVGGKNTAKFFYSTTNGLVAFSLASDGSFSPMYLLNEERGFPIR